MLHSVYSKTLSLSLCVKIMGSSTSTVLGISLEGLFSYMLVMSSSPLTAGLWLPFPATCIYMYIHDSLLHDVQHSHEQSRI